MDSLLVTFLWGFIPVAVWQLYFLTNDTWENRWNGAFRGPEPEDSKWDDAVYHDSDLEAFLWTFVDDTYPRIRWSMVILVPVAVGIAVAVAWHVIYVSIQVVA